MSLTNLLQASFGESWLALSRMLTCNVLEWRLRYRALETQYVPGPGKLLYVAASALPYHISGYTTRTHEVIRALSLAGGQVYALTRPGYPGDRKDRLLDALDQMTMVGDVCYRHVPDPKNNRPVLNYALEASRVIAEAAARHRVSVIHAASNHVNALPALLAARRLGIPFQYEMRGLWELTRISRQPAFEPSQGYKQGLHLEGMVARHADRLFVISEQVAQYAQERWGVSSDRMTLLPNCVDPENFVVPDFQQIAPDSVGYAGSLMGYEGLDTLIDAVDSLLRRGRKVTVHLIGDGEARPALEAQVQRLGLAASVRFYGKVSPDAARAALGRCALVCIPRKPFKVCEIVPPIKLVEALAMGKPVIVPDLPVFRDEMGCEPAGWFFKSGDAEDLAKVLDGALACGENLATLSARARAYAVTERSWQRFVANLLPEA